MVINRAHFSVRLDILSIDTNLHYMAIQLKLVGQDQPFHLFQAIAAPAMQVATCSCNRASYRHPDLRLKPAHKVKVNAFGCDR